MERVALFVDGQSLYFAAKLLDLEIDYNRVLRYFSDGDALVRARYYASIIDTDEHNPMVRLFDYLAYNGWKVTTKQLREHTDATGTRRDKSGIEVQLSCDALEISEHVDLIFLFIGDHAFLPLVEALQRRGKRVVIVSTKPATSAELRREADRFVDLETIRDSICRVTQAEVVKAA